MKDLSKNFGNKIKELRKKSKFTQAQLATKINVDPKYISRLETGTSIPSLNVILKISEALKVEIAELFTYENEQKKIKLIKLINSNLEKADIRKLSAILEVTKVMLN